MKKLLFLLLCIVLAQFTAVLAVSVQRPYLASAQETPHWLLVETRINSGNSPLQSTSDRRMTDTRTGQQKAFGGLTYYSITVSETVMTFQERSTTWDKGVEVKENYNYVYRFTFEKPPARLIPGETIELKASGTAIPAGASTREFSFLGMGAVDESENEGSRNLKITLGGEKTSGSIASRFTAWPMSYIRRQWIISAQGPYPGLTVEWVYEKRGLPSPAPTLQAATPTTRSSPTPTRALTTPTPVPPPTGTPGQAIEPTETPQERLERSIAQNLVDYIRLRKGIDRELQALNRRADNILYDLREAEWMLANGTAEDKTKAAADIARLKRDMAQLLADFETRVKPLTDVLKSIGEQFLDYRQRKELADTLQAYNSELNLLRLNIVLRSGNIAKFDELFPLYRNEPGIAADVYTANAFRQFMEGDMRIALESVRQALSRDSKHPMALQLLQEIELAYLARIRERVAAEMGENARLFNEKLDGHGERGMGRYLVDLLTTGVADSARAIAGYHDLVESTASINIDEAARQVAGIQLVEDLRRRGVTFEEIKGLSVERMRELVLEQYNRTITAEDARRLRDRLFGAFNNVDVNAIRRGEKTQFNIDHGKDFFDTEILQKDVADSVSRSFSAWETFLTFAPSAQLGKIANTGTAARLGLTAESTLQQSLARVFRVQELGHRIYQTRAGAALIDGLQEWNGFQTMVSEAIKNRLGEVGYEAGKTAASVFISQQVAESERLKKLKEDIEDVSDYYLGAGGTAYVSATIDTASGLFEFIGLNGEELSRGAYGRGNYDKTLQDTRQAFTKEAAVVNNPGVARAASRPRTLQEFEGQMKLQGASFPKNLAEGRDRLRNAGNGTSQANRQLYSQADQTLQQMQGVSDALSSGDRTRAQDLWNQMQSGAGQKLDTNYSVRSRGLGGLRDQLGVLDDLARSPPTPNDTIEQVMGILTKDQEYQAGTSEFLAALQTAGLKGIELK